VSRRCEVPTRVPTLVDSVYPSQKLGTASLIAQLGQDTDKTASAQAQLYAVELHLNRIRICFDVFLDHCTPEFRRQIDESVMRPIFAIANLGDGHGYHIGRKSPLDARIARHITGLQQFDKGPRPYFVDNMTMMRYNGYGIREEDDLEKLDPVVPSSTSPGRAKGDS
jgi:hypothetical protein